MKWTVKMEQWVNAGLLQMQLVDLQAGVHLKEWIVRPDPSWLSGSKWTLTQLSQV